MNENLIVFVCDSARQALTYGIWSHTCDFAYRSFIIIGEPLQVENEIWLKKSDFVMNLKNTSFQKYKIALRAGLLYSSPKFENIVFIYDLELPEIDEIKKAFQEISKKYNFKKINNCYCFAREYVVMNGFDSFDDIEQVMIIEEEYDAVSMGIQVGNALIGEPVSFLPFIEAIKEVISLDKFVIHESLLTKMKHTKVFIEALFKANGNKNGPASLVIIDEDLKKAEIEKIKKTLSPQGMILLFTREENKVQNPYKIIHHEDGTKAVLFR